MLNPTEAGKRFERAILRSLRKDGFWAHRLR